MRFAKIVFIGAGVWGIVVLMPFYWLVDLTGRQFPREERPTLCLTSVNILE